MPLAETNTRPILIKMMYVQYRAISHSAKVNANISPNF